MPIISEIHFVVEGDQCLSFNPLRGLRQGDTLSPYLFILGNEVLMRIINKEVTDGNISKVKVSSTTPPISKLCYADDVILFCKAKASELVSLKGCLEKYCSWSGQKISIEKSGFFLSKDDSHQFFNQVRCTWGLCSLPQHTTYLRVPLFLFRSRGQDFRLVKEVREQAQ